MSSGKEHQDLDFSIQANLHGAIWTLEPPMLVIELGSQSPYATGIAVPILIGIELLYFSFGECEAIQIVLRSLLG